MRIALLKEKYHPHISLTDTIGALTKMKRGIGLCFFFEPVNKKLEPKSRITVERVPLSVRVGFEPATLFLLVSLHLHWSIKS